MMSRSVFAYKAASVETEDDMQLLKSYVVDNLVVGSLHEGGIYVAEWYDSAGCEACRKTYCVFFGDADIECSVRKDLL